MTLFWGRVECEAAVGSNVRSVPGGVHMYWAFRISSSSGAPPTP